MIMSSISSAVADAATRGSQSLDCVDHFGLDRLGLIECQVFDSELRQLVSGADLGPEDGLDASENVLV